MKISISIIQFQPALHDPSENARRLKELIRDARGSKLIVLPELSNSGYLFRNKEEAINSAETIGAGGIFQDFLVQAAKENNCFIVSGINEKDGGNLYNSAILCGPGGIQGKYRKMHLFMNEKDIFTKGNAGLPVFDLGDFKIGIQICFDYLFPEPWRILAMKGADLVCHPSNLLTENPHRCIPGIALMNRIYIATANRIGREGDLLFNGQSFMTEPTGLVPKKLEREYTGVLHMEIDTEHSRNKMITARNHVFDDRRPDDYLF